MRKFSTPSKTALSRSTRRGSEAGNGEDQISEFMLGPFNLRFLPLTAFYDVEGCGEVRFSVPAAKREYNSGKFELQPGLQSCITGCIRHD